MIRQAARVGEQALDFAGRHAVVPAARARRPNGALVDPVFERRIPDADARRGLTDGQKAHVKRL